MEVVYTQTNENLNAIIAGLVPIPEDTILAVGGSGDQAFALLEFAGRVKVVDKDHSQTEYIRKRAEALRLRDYASFRRNANSSLYFFENKNRLERIRERLDHLAIAESADIVQIAPQEESYSKAYLSNAIGFPVAFNGGKIIRSLDAVAQKLTTGGLIYVANHWELVNAAMPSTLLLAREDILMIKSFLPQGLELDRALSKAARKYESEGWTPAVYRKI